MLCRRTLDHTASAAHRLLRTCPAQSLPASLPSRRQRVPRSSHGCMAALNGGGGIKTRTGSTKRPAGNELDRNGNSSAAGRGSESAEEGVVPVPLKYVVQEAVKRWFEDTLLEAQRGDVKQQALLGQMYAEGYGVAKDAKQAKEWSDRATSRGYRMQGVYCEL